MYTQQISLPLHLILNMVDNIHYIYKYSDENNIPFYIGLGKGKRMKTHLCNGKQKTHKKYSWKFNLI